MIYNSLCLSLGPAGWLLLGLGLLILVALYGYISCFFFPLRPVVAFWCKALPGLQLQKLLVFRGLLKSINSPFGEVDCRGLIILRQQVDLEVLIIDARHPGNIDENRLPEALHVHSFMDDAAITNLLPDKGTLLVLYCGDQDCPAAWMLGERLQELGYTSLLHLHGGLKAWQQFIALNKL